MNIGLKAESGTEKRILEYLEANASEALAEKINAGKKTLAGAVAHAKAEAQKMAAGAGVVCVEDATVFGWIIHFFEEDSVTEPVSKPRTVTAAGAARVVKTKAAPKPEAPKKAEAVPSTGPVQQDMLSALFGGDA